MECRNPLFREIHKNTWLKRVTADNRKIPVGTKVKKLIDFRSILCDDAKANANALSNAKLESAKTA